MPSLLAELTYTWRVARRRPLASFGIVGSLVLATTAAAFYFGALNAARFAALPYPEPGRLIFVSGMTHDRPTWAGISPGNAIDIAALPGVLDKMAYVGSDDAWLDTPTGIDEIHGKDVSPEFFRVLGRSALAGRTLVPEDARSGIPAVVLSHRLAIRLFASDSGAVGRTLVMDSVRRTVVGVMPPRFDFPNESQFWVPLTEASTPSRQCCAGVFGRLAPGISIASAQRSIAAAAIQLAAAFPRENRGLSLRIESLRNYESNAYSIPRFAVAGGVLIALLLILAVISVAVLVITRDIPRRGEFALRVALGASRARVARPYLVEGFVYGVTAGALGLLFAAWALHAVSAAAGEALPSWLTLTIDWRVVAAVGSMSILVAMGVAAIPMIQTLQLDSQSFLRSGSLGVRASRAMRYLVLIEIGGALAVMSVTAMICRKVIDRANVDPGFVADNVVRSAIYWEADSRASAFDRLTLAGWMRQVPGVADAGVLDLGPVESLVIRSDDGARQLGGTEQFDQPRLGTATPSAFTTLGVPLTRGRFPTSAEDRGRADVAVVTERVARRLFGDADPIGRSIRIDSADMRVHGLTVIGTLRDLNLATGVNDSASQLILSPSFPPAHYAALYVRTRSDPTRTIPMIDSVVRAMTGLTRVRSISLAASRAESIRQAAYPLWVVLPVGFFAMLVAAIGIFSLTGQLVEQHTFELAVRAALGATPSQCVGLIVRKIVPLAVAGLCVGVPAAVLLAPVLSLTTLLSRGVTATPFLLAAGVVITVMVVGVAPPLRRVANAAPAHMLRG